MNILDKEITYNSVDDKDILLLVNTVKQGIKYPVFVTLTNKSPFTLREWSVFLHLSERTLQRYKKEKKTFDPIYAEKILEIVLLYHLGLEVFGDRERLNTWFDTNNVALGGQKPKELLDNTFGISLLKDELTRIEQGVLA